jgi:hypothetical protein
MSCLYTAFGNYECNDTKNIPDNFLVQTENILENFATKHKSKMGDSCIKSSDCRGYTNNNGKKRLCCKKGDLPTCQDYNSNFFINNCI